MNRTTVPLTSAEAAPTAQAGSWWREAVVYQIYPRSFADASGDGVGDLRGIIDRLDYLQWLGVDAVWLSPVFSSPMADFGYDISDHCAIDPLFGTLVDAQELLEQAHARSLKVVFDVVLGHTSDQHRWFRESRSDRGSRLRDWYVWRDGPTPGSADGGPPNNWTAGFPAGAAAWTFDDLTRQWYLHSHLPEQPDLNWENAAVADAQERVLRFWLDRGVDGIRLDSITRLGKDPEFRDNLAGLPLRQQDWPTLHAHLRRVRQVLDEYPGRMLVGEVWLFEQPQLVPYLAADELHLAHNFVFARSDCNASQLADVLQEFADLVPDSSRAAWFFNNHDEPRTRSRFDHDGHGLARAELLAVLLLTLQGTVFLYQGEELGLPDTPLPTQLRTDPNGRDPQRTPMPWQPPSVTGPGAGFTNGHPWLPVGPDADQTNVAGQLADPRSTLHLYRRLIQVRSTSHPVAAHIVQEIRPDLLVVRQEGAAGPRITLVNFGTTPNSVPAEMIAELSTRRLVLSTDRSRSSTDGGSSLQLGPLEGLIIDTEGPRDEPSRRGQDAWWR